MTTNLRSVRILGVRTTKRRMLNNNIKITNKTELANNLERLAKTKSYRVQSQTRSESIKENKITYTNTQRMTQFKGRWQYF